MNNPASFPVSATPAPAQPAPPVVANPAAQIGMPSWLLETLTIFYQVGQVLYFFAFATMLYYFTRPINWVSPIAAEKIAEQDLPRIILLYPVLRELEATMRTTFLGLSNLEYPPSRYRVIAIPNSNDRETIASLRRLVMEFPFLEVLEVPPNKGPALGNNLAGMGDQSEGLLVAPGKISEESRPPSQENAAADLCILHPCR